MANSTSLPHADDLRRLAQQYLRDKRLDSAQVTLEALILREPGDLAARLELARVMAARGLWRASTRPLLDGLPLLPRNMPLILQLIQQLISRGQSLAARSCLDFLSQAPDPPSHLLLAQAHLRFALGEISIALQLAKRALNAGADDPDDYHLYAMLLQFSGDLAAAGKVLARCLARWPGYGDVAVVLANLHKHVPALDLLALVDKQLAKPLPEHAGADRKFVRADFEYARFRLLDDAGQHNKAWAALAHCNALMHELNPYDAGAVEAGTSAMIKATPTAPPHAPVQPDGNAPTPIFIVGLPRSGTTLLDRMLSSHSCIASAGEIQDFWQQLHLAADSAPAPGTGLRRVAEQSQAIDFAELGRNYLQQTRWRAGTSSHFIDKLPANIQAVGFIRRALPRARILHIFRPAMDVCFSNFKALFGNTSAYSYDQQALAHYYGQYARLVEHWRTHWPDAMLDVSYTSLVTDPAGTLRQVFDFLGLELEDACLSPEHNQAPVATPSNAQVREPVHLRGNGSWRAYASQLEPLQQALKTIGVREA
ncbi:MAG TPA: sulfotransferase [Rhodanobacteraceae bacterium]